MRHGGRGRGAGGGVGAHIAALTSALRRTARQCVPRPCALLRSLRSAKWTLPPCYMACASGFGVQHACTPSWGGGGQGVQTFCRRPGCGFFAVQIRMELAEKELALLSKEKELLEKEQTVQVLKDEVRDPGAGAGAAAAHTPSAVWPGVWFHPLATL